MCGRATIELEVDHKVPLSQGGAEHETNLQSLCIDCHDQKTRGEQQGAG
jgi:5-methylcytosine-specific restriction protein A